VSSILEALRELESRRPPAAERVVTPVALPPAPSQRPVGPLVAVTTGLGLGFLVFGTAVWVSGLFAPGDSVTPGPMPPPPPAAAAPDRPSWLDTADAPRARVEPNATPPERPARAAARPDEPPPPPPAATTSGPAKGAPAGRIDVVGIDYAPSSERRSATMLLDGRRVTLRQRESAAGIEVQLIMPNGVYVQRGGETFLVSPR
jgi:hypothetical protein